MLFVANTNRSRNSAKRCRDDEPEDVCSNGRPRFMVKEEPPSDGDQFATMKARYAGVTEQDIARKHIYEELFFSNSMDPFTQLGAARTQWAEQQVRATKTYLQKMTSSKKPLTQRSFIPDAGGQINWISDLDAVFTAINRSVTSLQNEKTVAKTQLEHATKILNSLVTARKHFLNRMSKLDSDLDLQQRQNKGVPVQCLGDATPPWMMRLAKNALVVYSCRVDIFFDCSRVYAY